MLEQYLINNLQQVFHKVKLASKEDSYNEGTVYITNVTYDPRSPFIRSNFTLIISKLKNNSNTGFLINSIIEGQQNAFLKYYTILSAETEAELKGNFFRVLDLGINLPKEELNNGNYEPIQKIVVDNIMEIQKDE